MTTPTLEQLKQWADNYVALWNAGDKEAWVKNWRSVAPGDFRMLDPVGTPEKRGFEKCAADSFDLFQPNVKFKIAKGTLFICDNEVAWLLENHITTDGETTASPATNPTCSRGQRSRRSETRATGRRATRDPAIPGHRSRHTHRRT